MPAGDGTGPMGMGAMTGRAAGFCAGYGVPGYMNPVGGRGLGRGFFGRGAGHGMGAGRRNMFYATGLPGWQRANTGWPVQGAVPQYAQPTRGQELDTLKNQAGYFEDTLEDLRKRIEELESENVEK